MAYTQKDHQAKVNAFEDVTIQMRELFSAKNWDYRDSFAETFKKWGLAMTCIRLGDKLNRLDSFALNQQMQVDDEKVEDTLMDLANYAIMTLVELQMAKKEMEGEQLCLK